MIVRNLLLADRLPAELAVALGFEKARLSPELAWVAVEGGRVVGVLVGFAAHGWFYPFRLCVARDAPYGCALRLLRKAFRDARNRGYDCYITVLDTTHRAGRTMLRVLESRGETAAAEVDMVCIGGRIDPLLHPTPPKRLKVVNG